jgi:hypothetical protein
VDIPEFKLSEWSDDLQPEEIGQYLFYGDLFGESSRPSDVDGFAILTVKRSANDRPLRVCGGVFWFDYKPKGKLAKILVEDN